MIYMMDPQINTATGEKLTFSDLFRIKNYRIEIPIIQRDYAQGRSSKEKIRTTFLDDLFDHINDSIAIDLDFVYGTIMGESGKLDKFIPLDGQQRLTTLFLLHWYLACKDKKISVFRELMLMGESARFTYETRTSSREFCNSLVVNDLDMQKLLPPDKDKKNSLSKTLKNSFWYFLSWDDDPTIKGMLTMLDAIHQKFQFSEGFYDRLISPSNPVVTFQFLNLQHLQMTDDLYIKMNARGKALTDYENFKAQFIKYLGNINSKYQDEFSDKIDGKWCDLFWDHAISDNKILYSIDDCILNYFKFISEMLYYLTINDEDWPYDFDDFQLIEQIYKAEDNLKFLMRSLDLFSNSHAGEFRGYINGFFSATFTEKYFSGRVALFEKDINLFEKLIYRESSLEHTDKMVLFALIHYFDVQELTLLEPSDNLRDYLRVCRNFILKINQKGNSAKKDEFVTEMRTGYYHDIMHTCTIIFDPNIYDSLPMKIDRFKFRKDNIAAEILKAKVINGDKNKKIHIHQLEDHVHLKGDLINLEPLLEEESELDYIATTFYELFKNVPNDKIIRSLLAVGDYSQQIGNSYYGPLYFFGTSEKWHRILTTKDDDGRVKSVLKNYFPLLRMSTKKTLDGKINELIATGQIAERPAWLKLFMKYPVITQTKTSIFSIREKGKFEMVRFDGMTLGSWHTNSIIHAVAESGKLNTEIKNDIWEMDSNESVISLKYSSYMLPRGNSWFIDAKSQDYSELAAEFKLVEVPEKNQFRLNPNKKEDMVEIGIRFFNAIYQ